jgi:hypothetical protein
MAQVCRSAILTTSHWSSSLRQADIRQFRSLGEMSNLKSRIDALHAPHGRLGDHLATGLSNTETIEQDPSGALLAAVFEARATPVHFGGFSEQLDTHSGLWWNSIHDQET